jgi:hypothetical protein
MARSVAAPQFSLFSLRIFELFLNCVLVENFTWFRLITFIVKILHTLNPLPMGIFPWFRVPLEISIVAFFFCLYRFGVSVGV